MNKLMILIHNMQFILIHFFCLFIAGMFHPLLMLLIYEGTLDRSPGEKYKEREDDLFYFAY